MVQRQPSQGGRGLTDKAGARAGDEGAGQVHRWPSLPGERKRGGQAS